MADVKFEKVEKTYPGDVYVVKGIDLEIRDKELMVLVGPSGCGKSTTLRMIAGLEEITGGEMKIDDVVVNNIAPRDRDIAFVFQTYALYPQMTVYENMAFALKVKKLPKEEIHTRVMDAAEILELGEYLDRLPKALSGGQRQRVALGRAIVRKPKVFLLDEPLSNLDAKMRATTRREIHMLQKRLDTTMIYVTHDQVEAMTLGHRICVMKDGIIEQVGEPMDVYDNPASVFVATFIGTIPANIIRGTFDGTQFTGPKGCSFTVPLQYHSVLEQRISGDITLSIRPEFMDLKQTAATPDAFIEGVVEVVEQLGDFEMVYLQYEGGKCILKVDAKEEVKEGQRYTIYTDMTKVHFYDGESEENLNRL